MSPFARQALVSILRAAIVWIAAKFGANISDDEAVKLAAELLPFVLMVLWSLYDRFVSERATLMAQAMPKGVTRDEVEAEVRAGNAPAVNTPKDVAPI